MLPRPDKDSCTCLFSACCTSAWLGTSPLSSYTMVIKLMNVKYLWERKSVLSRCISFNLFWKRTRKGLESVCGTSLVNTRLRSGIFATHSQIRQQWWNAPESQDAKFNGSEIYSAITIKNAIKETNIHWIFSYLNWSQHRKHSWVPCCIICPDISVQLISDSLMLYQRSQFQNDHHNSLPIIKNYCF
jgi:hypothetical protein